MRHKGFTLIEIMLTLAITIILLSSAFYIYQKILTTLNVAKITEQIVEFKGEYDNFSKIQNNFSKNSVNDLIIGKILNFKIVKGVDESNIYISNNVEIMSLSGNLVGIRYIPTKFCLPLAMQLKNNFSVYSWNNSTSPLINKSIYDFSNIINTCNSYKTKTIGLVLKPYN